MHKNVVKALGALIVLIFLLLMGWWKDKQITKKNSDQEKEETVVALNFEEVNRFTIENAQGTTLFEKRSKDKNAPDALSYLDDEFVVLSDWAFTQNNQKSLANRSMMDSLESHLKALKSIKIISDDANRAKEYGLETPRTKLSFYKKNEQSPFLKLSLGDENIGKSAVYAKSSSSEKIYLVDKLFGFLDQKTQDWKETRIMGFPKFEQVQKIEFIQNNEQQLLLKKENNQWWVEGKNKLPSDDALVEAFVQEIETLNTKETFDESKAKELGLTRTSRLTVWVDQKGVVKEKTLFLGHQNKEKDQWYVSRPEQKTIEAIRTSFYSTLTKPTYEWVTKKLFFTKEEVTEVEVDDFSKPFVLVQKNGTWVNKKDNKRVFSSMYDVLGLEAKKVLGKPKPVQAKNKVLSLKITSLPKEKQQQVDIYQGDQHDFFANHVLLGVWYEMEGGKIEMLQSVLKDFEEGKVSTEVKEKPKQEENDLHEGHSHE